MAEKSARGEPQSRLLGGWILQPRPADFQSHFTLAKEILKLALMSTSTDHAQNRCGWRPLRRLRSRFCILAACRTVAHELQTMDFAP